MHTPSQPSNKVLRGTQKYVYGRDGSHHSYSQEERKSFANYINYVLKDDKDLGHLLPMDEDSDQIFKVASEGLLLCKLVKALAPGTIDEGKVVVKSDPNPYEVLSNISIALQGAKDLGCTLVNINIDDIRQGKPHIVLGFLWRLIRTGLLKQVTIEKHPELLHIVDKNEDISEFVKSKPEANLLKWFNYHLKKANHPRRVTNFKGDISDGENYLVLLEQIAPDGFLPKSLHKEPHPSKRTQLVCEAASALDALKFVTPDDIAQGNEKLNLAFTAHLFNKYPGLEKKASPAVSTDELLKKQREAEEADKQYKALLREEQRLEDERARIEQQMRAEEERLKQEEETMRAKEEALLRDQMAMRNDQNRQADSNQAQGPPPLPMHNQPQYSQQNYQPEMQTQPQPQMYNTQPQMQTQPPPQMQTQPPPMQSHSFQPEVQTQPFYPPNYSNHQHQWSQTVQSPYPPNIMSTMASTPVATYSPPFQTVQTVYPPPPVAYQTTQMIPTHTVVVTSPPPPPPPRVVVTTTTTTFRRRR